MESDEISFEDLGLDEQTLAAVARKGFVTPSPIQVLAIPRLLNGDANVIARARTGTGKTAAFGLPLVQKLRDKSGRVSAIILEPTRELAVQTCAEMQSFAEGASPHTCVVYGGAPMGLQIKELRHGTEIVVGTPGRVQDLMDRGVLDISKIEYFILDEGDEMLDMGFIDDIESIFKKANPESRILLFSATMPEQILKIAQKFMGEYEIVEEEGVIETPLLIDQNFWVVRESDKIEALIRLIDISPDFYGLVFTQTKMDADSVSRRLDERGYEVAALHGDIAQNQREKILARFRTRKTRILVATDVAARGIDITGLSHVVNYSLPFDGAAYVHRIGRTGRAGATGIAITFVRPEERRKLAYLQSAIKKASKGELKEEPVPSVEDVITVKRTRLFEHLKEQIGLSPKKEEPSAAEKKSFESDEIVPMEEQQKASEVISNEQAADAESVLQNTVVVPQSLKLITPSSFFTDMAVNLCENQKPEDVLAAVLSIMYGTSFDKSHYGDISAAHSVGGSSGDQMRLYVQMGRQDGYSPRAIADYFSTLLHIPGRLVDRIDMSSTFSLISLPTASAEKALELSKRDGSIPHMHVDVKEGGGPRGGFRGGERSSFGGHRGGGDSGHGFSGGHRGFRDKEKDGQLGSKSFKSHGRPNVHTATERNSQGAVFKRNSGKAERY
jgi:ATP-dependent RNA helicase DeaD